MNKEVALKNAVMDLLCDMDRYDRDQHCAMICGFVQGYMAGSTKPSLGDNVPVSVTHYGIDFSRPQPKITFEGTFVKRNGKTTEVK